MITFLKKTFNISGCEISISPERSVFHQGEEVKCSFNITGGQYEQTADEIIISLEESWTESTGGDPPSSRTVRVDRVARVVGKNTTIKPGETKSYEFSAELPQNCILSDASDSLGWCLVVKIDIPHAKDPKERISIEVIDHREFLAIEDALQSVLKFEKKKSALTKGKRFIPPAVLRSELDCLDIHFNQNGSTTECELVFDLQEKTLLDYFKMIVRQDKVKREIKFKRDQLFDKNFSPDTQEITKIIAEEIKQVLMGAG